MNKVGIGVPNNNIVSTEDIPNPPSSLYELETSEYNYRLESGAGYYRTEKNYTLPSQFKYLLESGLAVYGLESGLGDYRLEDQ